MKKVIFVFLFISSTLVAQTNTEVYVFDIINTHGKYDLKNGKNISNNNGYDNQPFFYNLNQVVFASSRDKNTDILFYDLITDKKRYISNTKNGGEYSPQRIPKSNHISAVRLDNDGLQRFYKYNFKRGKISEIIPDLKVAYPTWFDKNTLIAVSIEENDLELFICDLKKKTKISVAKKVGRSVHKIPNTNLISFISKENEKYWLLKSLNPITKEIKTITSIGKSNDVNWLPNGNLLISKDNSIYKFNPKKDKYPSLFFNFTDENINNISRMALNENGSKIALVAEISPRSLAQEQLDAYNKREIEAFLKPYSKNVKVYDYPNTLRYKGIENMKKEYTSFFNNTKDLHCKILKRIVYKNKVIDHELVTSNGRTYKAVAIYTIKNGKIDSVTFL